MGSQGAEVNNTSLSARPAMHFKLAHQQGTVKGPNGNGMSTWLKPSKRQLHTSLKDLTNESIKQMNGRGCRQPISTSLSTKTCWSTARTRRCVTGKAWANKPNNMSTLFLLLYFPLSFFSIVSFTNFFC